MSNKFFALIIMTEALPSPWITRDATASRRGWREWRSIDKIGLYFHFNSYSEVERL
ncbi:hypothetical protein [Agrobacterium arsenijevicii]|uniref:hypothetical protein n=1 Tax=Agrobacterium arsenijevicii TaxID=1585697 RepID=UPI000AE06193